jgi:hypothetical protein
MGFCGFEAGMFSETERTPLLKLENLPGLAEDRRRAAPSSMRMLVFGSHPRNQFFINYSNIALTAVFLTELAASVTDASRATHGLY